MTINLSTNSKKYSSLYITHNAHNSSYEVMSKYIKEDFIKPFLTPEEAENCIKTDSIWEIQLYPRTPISFYKTVGSTFEIAMNEMNDILKLDGLKPPTSEACEACPEEQDASPES
jgi:hypothetical protein